MYNVEKYICECLESILAQSIYEKEIIIINDGSTDNSLAIAEEYKNKYPFIKTISKENSGISAARNDGILYATGEYICFVDSDDFYIYDFAYHFYKLCRDNDLDIIRGTYSIFDDESKVYLNSSDGNISYNDIVLTGIKFLTKSIAEHVNEVVPWLGFFKREYLLQNKLLFPEGIAYEEDQDFFLKALLIDNGCKVMQTDVNFYAYRKRVGSATKTPILKQAEDVVYVVKSENKFIKQLNLDKVSLKYAKKYICSSFYQLTSIYGRVGKDDRKKIRKIVDNNIVRQCLMYPYNWHQFFKIFLFTYLPWIVDFVYRIKLRKRAKDDRK